MKTAVFFVSAAFWVLIIYLVRGVFVYDGLSVLIVALLVAAVVVSLITRSAQRAAERRRDR